MKRIIIILTIICILYSLFFDINSWFLKEDFISNNKILFKKTMTYDLIYYNNIKNFSIWTPRIIDDYYPLGHIIKKDKTPPNLLSILIKSQNIEYPKDRPQSYEPITILLENNKNKGAIWRPIVYKNYISLGHIYHSPITLGKIPSVHKHIRCINKQYLTPTSLNSIVTKDSKSPGYEIWNIHNSNLFIGNEKISNNEPKEKVFIINKKYLHLPYKIKTKDTVSYKLIYTKYNKSTNKYLSIWRPLSIDNYVSLGDIALDKDPKKYNPNNKLKTMLVHKSMVKTPEGFGVNYKGYIKTNKKIDVTFWKPDPPIGYGCIGYVANMGEFEPRQNNIIYCIPLEYFKNSKKKELWNSNHIPNNRISFWSDSNNFFIVNNNYSYHKELDLELDEDFIDYEKDILDKKTIISLTYKLNLNNTELYNSDARDKLYRNTLINRLGIKSSRIGYMKFYGSRVSIELIPRPAGSEELTIADSIKNIKSLINSNLQINNSKNDGYISTINNILIDSESDHETTKIDNSKFTKQVRKIY